MKIAILGAGWYGCHMASVLIRMGCDVEIFEKANSIFSGASSKNQNRLHTGFHYPRSYETRFQSSEGYNWFKKHYPSFLNVVDNNYYCVAKNKSMLDMKTYLQIMDASGLNYEKVEAPCVSLKNIEGVIRVDEMLVRNDLATEYFHNTLSPYVRLNQPIVFENMKNMIDFGSDYDYVIDCTWKAANKVTELDVYFEPCIYFYYEKLIDTDFALTIMDGKFFSLYPYNDNMYTLTSVEHTPISTNCNYNDAMIQLSRVTNKVVNNKKMAFVELTETYYPDFLKHFKYKGVEFSVKTKINSASDFRGSLLEINDNYISVYSGKIDTIHVVERKILEVIS